MISAYKTEGVSNERGFRFLKALLFFTHSLFLEKPERIMALLMIIGLSLPWPSNIREKSYEYEIRPSPTKW